MIQDIAPRTARTRREDVRFEQLTMPDVPAVRRPGKLRTRGRAHWYHDRWLVALLVCAACASCAAAFWAYASSSILLYADAHAHLLIARRVLDNVSPGLAQLGDVWLPLPQLIMVPLAWNDFLWRTGLAGTLTSMVCYLIACLYVFLTARRLTRSSRASFIGSLVFVLNPNVLYLQTTPLSEPVLFATLIAASYYFVVWTQEDRLRDLIYAALATLLATSARYDGWALFLALAAAIVLVDVLRRQAIDKMFGDVILFAMLGGVGIVLWFIWNLVIFGSPLAFLSGSYSSQSQTQTFIQLGVADGYHHLWLSIRSYTIAAAESVGPVVLALSALGVVVFLLRKRLSPETVAACTVLVPFAFYVAAFYLGQDVMYVPFANHPPALTYYNARFGAEMTAPAAVFIAILADTPMSWLPVPRLLSQLVLLVVVGQTVGVAWGGVIALQDGQIGSSCYIAHPIAVFLAQHYDGGRLLVNVYSTNIDLSVAGIPFRNEIYEGDGTAWDAALRNPSRYVEWIIAAPHDLVSQHIDMQSATFRQEYSPMVEESVTGAMLWHLNTSAPLPTRPLPENVVTPYLACNHAKHVPIALTTSSPIALAPPADDAPVRARPQHVSRRAALAGREVG